MFLKPLPGGVDQGRRRSPGRWSHLNTALPRSRWSRTSC